MKRTLTILGAALFALVVILCSFAACSDSKENNKAPTPTVTVTETVTATPTAQSTPQKRLLPSSAAPTPKPIKTTKPALPTTIKGDDIVKVGTDIQAGTYRTTESVGGEMCYWNKSKDPEGQNIIANGIPTGGKPSVTLKKGQWFTSQGCPSWTKQ